MKYPYINYKKFIKQTKIIKNSNLMLYNGNLFVLFQIWLLRIKLMPTTEGKSHAFVVVNYFDQFRVTNKQIIHVLFGQHSKYNVYDQLFVY